MILGVPVLARNISGNSAVIKHRESGLLFDTPQVRHVKRGVQCSWQKKTETRLVQRVNLLLKVLLRLKKKKKKRLTMKTKLNLIRQK